MKLNELIKTAQNTDRYAVGCQIKTVHSRRLVDIIPYFSFPKGLDVKTLYQILNNTDLIKNAEDYSKVFLLVEKDLSKIVPFFLEK